MYLKSIDELPTPLFRSLHSSLIIAFHYLPSPFITFHRRPISLSAHSLLSRFVLPSPRFVLVSLPFCPHLAPLSHHAPAFPRFTLASLLLHHPLCFTHPSFTHHCLRSFVLLPFFYSLCFTPSIVFTLSHCFTSFVLFLPPLLYSLHCFTPLCFAHSIVLHRFALLSTIVYPPLLYSLPLFTPPSLYLLPLFCTRFFTPWQPPQTRPRHRKRQRFSHFSKKFCKKPLTKQKKVLY